MWQRWNLDVPEGTNVRVRATLFKSSHFGVLLKPPWGLALRNDPDPTTNEINHVTPCYYTQLSCAGLYWLKRPGGNPTRCTVWLWAAVSSQQQSVGIVSYKPLLNPWHKRHLFRYFREIHVSFCLCPLPAIISRTISLAYTFLYLLNGVDTTHI